jgi:chorismate mutase
MPIRGIRGAVPARANTKAAIASATRQLLRRMMQANAVANGDIAGIILTSTPDLDADFPAAAARSQGWGDVPLLCAQEIDVPGAMKRIIRALVFFNTDLAQADIHHVYLGAAGRLRPDLTRRFRLRSRIRPREDP